MGSIVWTSMRVMDLYHMMINTSVSFFAYSCLLYITI